jgi:hypothetical protein
MKRIFLNLFLPGLSVFILTSFSTKENPQDPPRSKKTEKHIKIVKVDDDGKKTELDTIIEGDKVFVWQGDTVGGKDFTWISKDGFDLDNIHENFDMNFEYKIEDDGEGKFIIMKSGKKGGHIIMPPVALDAPFPPHAPRVMFSSNKNKNMIDLSDPGIISYDKKLRKDGTEKIVIVRKQQKENEEEEIIINGTSGEKGNSTFVTDDGKVIKIRESKEGEDKQIEVEIEEKTEKENK